MRILSGRNDFYQWDSNQKITGGLTVGEKVEFTNGRVSPTYTLEAYELDGKIVVDVPNILLQTASPIVVYRREIDGNSVATCAKQTFNVKQREKPSDYVYTETEVLTWTTLDERIKAIEQGGGSGGSGEDGASAYDIAVAHGFKGTESEWLESLKGEDGYTPVKNIDYFDGKDAPTVTVTTEKTYRPIDGRSGMLITIAIKDQNGLLIDSSTFTIFDGEPGYSPVRCVDYWTDEDKEEIVNEVVGDTEIALDRIISVQSKLLEV